MQQTEQRFAAVSSSVKTRRETFNGREHIVVPVVALVEGVIQAMNASNAEFVAAEEFEKAPEGWNGRPVFVDHPLKGGVPVFGNQPDILEKRQIGIVFNAKATNSKLTMEAWIDVERARGLEPVLLERLEAGDPIEISVGLLCATSTEAGKFGGKSYKGAWKDLVPDHLALLSKGHTGACSREMGCGVRAALGNGCNQHGCPSGGSVEDKLKAKNKLEADLAKERQDMGRKKKIDKTLGGVFSRMMELFRVSKSPDEMSGNDLMRSLYEALRKVDTTVGYVETYLPVVNPDRVVYYCVYPPVEGVYDQAHTTALFERSFSVGENGVITLGDNVIEVEPVMYYEPVLMSETPDESVEAPDEEGRAAIGKRNSAKDQARVQSMHNYALELGATCDYKAAEVKTACGCHGKQEIDLRDLLRDAADKFVK